MHLPPISLLSLALLAGLAASGQVVSLTPRTLDSWSLTGAEKNSLAQDQHLALPAGAQLSREFPSSPVMVHLVSRPVWPETAADWPILEVGPAALVLLKKAGQGQLVLLVGEDQQVDLPWPVTSVALEQPLDIFLGYDPVIGTGLVVLQDQIQRFETGASLKPVEVILTAGDKSPWPQDTLEVIVLDRDADSRRRNIAALDQAGKEAQIMRMKSAMDQLRDEVGPSRESRPEAGGAFARPVPTPDPALEIFTPPAVRRGRAEEARALVANNPKR